MKMKKLILLSLTLGAAFPTAHVLAGGNVSIEAKKLQQEAITNAADKPENNNNASETAAKSNETKMDPFSLPKDLQNELLDWCYPPEEYKDKELFLETVKEYFSNKYQNNDTPLYRDLKEQFFVKKVPILCYNLTKDKKPIIHAVGEVSTLPCILATAKYSRLSRLLKALTPTFDYQISLETSEGLLLAELKITHNVCIHSCALSAEGLLALEWSESTCPQYSDHYISFFTVDDIKDNSVDLTKNCHQLNYSTAQVLGDYPFELKGKTIDAFRDRNIIFNLQNQLVELSHQHGNTHSLLIRLIGIAPPIVKLTYIQKAKRLMLPTTQLKEQLELQDRANPENSDCSIQ